MPIEYENFKFGDLPGLQSISGATRVVYYVLKAGIDILKSDGTEVDRIFRLLPPEERQSIKKVLKKMPLNVRHGYARSAPTMPFCTIMRTSEKFERSYVSDFLGVEDPNLSVHVLGQPAHTPANKRHVVHGSRVQSMISVMIYAGHKDVADYYYDIVWTLLHSARVVFERAGITPGDMTGNEIVADPTLFPDFNYMHRITLILSGERTYSLSTTLVDEIVAKAKEMIISDVKINPAFD